MSLYESDWHYSRKQILHVHYTSKLRKCSVGKISWHNLITITENMDWGQHIYDISPRATKTLGFLRRNLAFAPRGVQSRLHTKLWYALNWSMQYLFGTHFQKLRFNKWRRYRGRQLDWSVGGGATLDVLGTWSISCNDQLLRPGCISLLYFFPQDSL